MIVSHSPNAGHNETVTTDDHAVALDMTHDPFTRKLGNLGWHGQREAARLPGRDNGLRNRVLGGLIERSSEAQDVALGHAVVTIDRDDLRPTVGQRAGLVEDQRADARHRLERPRALDQHAKMRRA